MDDIELVSSFKQGDEAAFDNLVLRYQDRIFRVCLRMLSDYEEANDLAQDVFVKAYRSLKGFRLDSKFSTWLYAIAINTCKNRLASLEFRHSRKALRIDDPVETEDGTRRTEIPDESMSPRTAAANSERAALIEKAIDSLAAEQKEMVVLRDIEGLSYEDIARITENNIGTVKSKLSRARQELREKLKKVI